MNNKNSLSITIAILLSAVILFTIISNLHYSLEENGSGVVWFGEGEYDIQEINTTDIAGNSYTYSAIVNDTRSVIFTFTIPFVFGDSPEWWQSFVGEEWLDIGEYTPGSAVMIEDGQIIIRGFSAVQPGAFWDCFHNFNICIMRSDDRPLIYR